jgi:hypothetical protein
MTRGIRNHPQNLQTETITMARDSLGREGPKTLDITLSKSAVAGVDIGGGKTLMPGKREKECPADIAVRLLANGRAKLNNGDPQPESRDPA